MTHPKTAFGRLNFSPLLNHLILGTAANLVLVFLPQLLIPNTSVTEPLVYVTGMQCNNCSKMKRIF